MFWEPTQWFDACNGPPHLTYFAGRWHDDITGTVLVEYIRNAGIYEYYIDSGEVVGCRVIKPYDREALIAGGVPEGTIFTMTVVTREDISCGAEQDLDDLFDDVFRADD